MHRTRTRRSPCHGRASHGAGPSASKARRWQASRRGLRRCDVQRPRGLAGRFARLALSPPSSAASWSWRPTSSSRARRPRSRSRPRQCRTLAIAPIVTLAPPRSSARSVGHDIPARSATSAADRPRRLRASRRFSPSWISNRATDGSTGEVVRDMNLVLPFVSNNEVLSSTTARAPPTKDCGCHHRAREPTTTQRDATRARRRRWRGRTQRRIDELRRCARRCRRARASKSDSRRWPHRRAR